MDEVFTVSVLTPIRKVIAARMSEANRTIPHFRVSMDLEMDSLQRLRSRLQRCPDSSVPSLNDFLIKACAGALMEVPALNVQWAETGIRQFETADIAVVVSVPGGLSTPIVRSANLKSPAEIGRAVKDLAGRAAKNALRMDEIMGGSFTISNLGMYGIDQFDAIINPPQCAILAVGAAKPRVVADANAQLRVATVLRATLAVDHRAVDGVVAARFMAAVRRRVDSPEEMIVSEGPDESRPSV